MYTWMNKWAFTCEARTIGLAVVVSLPKSRFERIDDGARQGSDARPGKPLAFCYEAGPCAYGVHRQLISLGHRCDVVAPSLIPTKPGDRVKTNRRDATMLARLHRAGELTPVFVPDAGHEAIRDLIRLRSVVRQIATRARQHLQGFLLRHGRKHGRGTAW
jgi:transposase